MNKLKIIPIAALVFCAVALTACEVNINIGDNVRGSGDVKTEDRPISGVTGVALSTVGELSIEMGDQESLRVEAEDNLLQYFETTVQGGVLTIETAPDVGIRTTKPVRYYLVVKSLESIEVSSSGNVSAGMLTGMRLTVRISSSGDVRLAGLEAESLEVRLSSSGKLTIDGGSVQNQEVRLSSSGDYDGSALRSASARVDVTSSGSATIWVTDLLDGNLSSSGDLEYYGSPQVSVDTSSSGDVRSLGNR